MSESYLDEAIKLLDYYLDDAIHTDYAIMLSAPWGAGKTHFIEKYLDDRSVGIVGKKDPYYLYVSLFGVTTISEIKDQFFAQSHPQLGSKSFQLFGNMASGVLEKFSGVKGGVQALKELLLDLDGKILVIDDLERCSLKISDVMGFINALVEHEKLKVIILANEDEIPLAQRDDYNRQKEKLVGKTIEVKANPADVLDKLANDLRSVVVQEVVSLEKTAILATFSASKKPNYRNLRAILADFERLVGEVDTRLSDAPDALKQLLLYMIATGCEARSAELSEAVLRNLPTSTFSMARLFSKAHKTDAEDAFGVLVGRYPDVYWTDPIISPKHLANLFFSGKIFVAAINEELARHPKVVGYAQTPTWRLLWDWSSLTKSEYEKGKVELRQELYENKITAPCAILHVAGIAITLRGYGENLIDSSGDLTEYFKDYVSKLLDADALVPHHINYGIDSISSGGLGYSSKDTPEFASIHAMVKDASAEVLRKYMKAKAHGYVDRLSAGPENYSSLYEYGIGDDNYGGIPFLQHINIDDFAGLLIADSRANIQLFASLAKRYEGNRHNGHPLVDEYSWVENLKKHLFAVAAADSAPFSMVLHDRLSYYFDSIREGTGSPALES